MSETAARARRRIGQLIRLLSSDQPGEAGAAAQALNRTLASAGLDIHTLAEVAEASLPDEPAKRPPPSAAARTNARRPVPPLTMNETLICDEPSGVFRACGCGGILFTVEHGVGPHIAKLVCAGCGAGARWLARRHFEAAP